MFICFCFSFSFSVFGIKLELFWIHGSFPPLLTLSFNDRIDLSPVRVYYLRCIYFRAKGVLLLYSTINFLSFFISE